MLAVVCVPVLPRLMPGSWLSPARGLATEAFAALVSGAARVAVFLDFISMRVFGVDDWAS